MAAISRTAPVYVPPNPIKENNLPGDVEPPPPPPTGPLGGPGGDFPDLTWNTDGYAHPGFTATNFGQYAPSGWDQTKWADPKHQTPKYVWGRIYQSNPNTADGRANMIKQLQQAYPGTTLVGNDKANIPGVGLIDLWTAADIGQFGISWNPVDEYRQDDPVGTGTGTGTDTGTGTGTGTMTTPAASTWTPPDFSAITSQLGQPWTPEQYQTDFGNIRDRIYSSTADDPFVPYDQSKFPGPFPTTANRGATEAAFASRVQELLTQLMSRSQSPLATDPEIALPSAAYRGQQQRSEERQRAELAERARFEGWEDSGAFDTELRGLQQQRGQNEAGYEAGLWAEAAQRRVSELTQAATLGSQFLTQQDQLQLEREITELNRGIEQARLAQNESQFGREFGENRRQYNLGLETQLALEQARLGQNESQFGREWGENRRQFDIDQSARLGIEQARLWQQAMEAALRYGTSG